MIKDETCATTGKTRPRIIPDQLCMENQVAMEWA